MQTQSEVRSQQWTAQTDTRKRSVFGNYQPENLFGVLPPASTTSAPDGTTTHNQQPPGGTPNHLQSAIDLAVARSFIYRVLAQTFQDPTPESWAWLCQPATRESFQSAWKALQLKAGESSACPAFESDAFDSFHSAYLAVFGHAARGSCPLNEIEYGDLKADPLFQPHRLADLAAFYRAFGLELAYNAGERQDHICLELEFMCVLAAREAYALENQFDADDLSFGRDAQKRFLRDHLGRWVPAFTRRLSAASHDPTLMALATFTRAFVTTECVCFGTHPGSEDLLLRPADEAAERMCDSCGIGSLPPGAESARPEI
jgi:DMSO reductase family type II enzyme chaperone